MNIARKTAGVVPYFGGGVVGGCLEVQGPSNPIHVVTSHF